MRRAARLPSTAVRTKTGAASAPAFDVLSDPVRRRILELLAKGEHTAGAVVDVIQREFGISQAAVSQHLNVLRQSGFANVRTAGQRRIYTVAAGPLQEIDSWLEQFRGFWEKHLNSLTSEVARGKSERRTEAPAPLKPSRRRL